MGIKREMSEEERGREREREREIARRVYIIERERSIVAMSDSARARPPSDREK